MDQQFYEHPTQELADLAYMNQIKQIPDAYMHLVFSLNHINDEMYQMMLNGTFPMEEWKIINYKDIKPNNYEVSNYGRIRNCITGIILKQQKGSNYYHITYSILPRGQKAYTTHKIVAKHFVYGETEERNEIDHIDSYKNENGIKCNNFYMNLEWVTRSENNKRAYNKGIMCRKCEKHHLTELTNQEVIQICKLIANYNNYINGMDNEIYDIMIKINPNITSEIIKQIRIKRNWKDISDLYFSDIYCERNITREDAHLICQSLLKHNRNTIEVKKELPQYSKNVINQINNKTRWVKISDLYFKNNNGGNAI